MDTYFDLGWPFLTRARLQHRCRSNGPAAFATMSSVYLEQGSRKVAPTSADANSTCSNSKPQHAFMHGFCNPVSLLGYHLKLSLNQNTLLRHASEGKLLCVWNTNRP